MGLIRAGRPCLFVIIPLMTLWLLEGAFAQTCEKKVVMIVPSKNFWYEELKRPKEIFEQNGIRVIIASSDMKEAKGIFGLGIMPDVVLSKIRAAHYHAVIFVGGEGAVQYWDDPHAHRLVKEALAKGIVLGASSIAPMTLANARALSGKRATVWPSLGERLKLAGAIYTGQPVEVDGKIVTADSPDAVEEFAQAILKAVLQK